MNRLKRYLIAGVLIWAPIWITFLLIRFLVETFDNIMMLLPRAYQPDVLLGFHIPGLGLVVTLLVVLATGVLVTNFIGKYIIKIWEAILKQIPLVRSVYLGVKKVLAAILSSGNMSFRKVVLVEYPRKDLWTIAFQTGAGFVSAETQLGKELVNVFVPTTPNPTSGFLLLLPREDVIELDISVDEALKMVISLGVILPEEKSTLQKSE